MRTFADVRARLAREARLERVALARGHVLQEPGEKIASVYFPIDALVSLVTVVSDGAVETGLVGREGLVGLPLLLGVPVADRRAVCLIPGDAWRAPATAVRRAAAVADESLAPRLLRYSHTVLRESAQRAACISRHPVERRCARWLLTVADRLAADTFPMTQQVMADTLGVRRATVVGVLGALEREGILDNPYGAITIRDRAGLAAAACECYAVLRASA